MSWCPSCGAEYRVGYVRCSECDVLLTGEPPSEPRIGPEWAVIVAFTTAEEARLARGYLREQGVVAEILDREMHAAPYGMALLDEVQLLVPPSDERRGRELLAAAREAGEPADREPAPDAGDSGASS